MGYHFVAANWYCESGELDIVMLDDEELVFIEVKTRRGERAGRAEEAVSSAKVTKLLKSADWFISDHPEHEHRIWRCDLVAVTLDGSLRAVITHHVNAIVSG